MIWYCLHGRLLSSSRGVFFRELHIRHQARTMGNDGNWSACSFHGRDIRTPCQICQELFLNIFLPPWRRASAAVHRLSARQRHPWHLRKEMVRKLALVLQPLKRPMLVWNGAWRTPVKQEPCAPRNRQRWLASSGQRNVFRLASLNFVGSSLGERFPDWPWPQRKEGG